MQPIHSCATRWYLHVLVLLATVLGVVPQPVSAQTYPNLDTPEGWAWYQIKNGRAADINVHCGTSKAPLDARSAKEDSRWANSCRRLPASFVVNVLTRSPWREHLQPAGVTIIGARIVGDISFESARPTRKLVIISSRIDNHVNFELAKTDDHVGILSSRVEGKFSAVGFASEQSLSLRNTEFKQSVSLTNAKLSGQLMMDALPPSANLSVPQG